MFLTEIVLYYIELLQLLFLCKQARTFDLLSKNQIFYKFNQEGFMSIQALEVLQVSMKMDPSGTLFFWNNSTSQFWSMKFKH